MAQNDSKRLFQDKIESLILVHTNYNYYLVKLLITLFNEMISDVRHCSDIICWKFYNNMGLGDEFMSSMDWPIDADRLKRTDQGIPRYELIAEAIEGAIVAGRLRSG